MKSLYCCRIKLDEEECFLTFSTNFRFIDVKILLQSHITVNGYTLEAQLKRLCSSHGFGVHTKLPQGCEIDYMIRFQSPY